MKKLFLTFILTISMIFISVNESYSQASLGVNAGYSWLSGIVGAEVEIGHVSGGFGYMPTSMPGSGEPVSSISWFVTYQDAVFQESSGYYIGFGQALKGYREETSYNGGAWTDAVVAPIWIGMVGYKYNWDAGLNMKWGVGYGWCEYAGTFLWEITIGYKIGLD